ncbi:hypothetical protein [Methylobacterium nodulans]|uniref:Uncharacterized protein n=1 Tax=Methylobacterium nodulans (strain LMG 21967 / CNCM I-2342 / ORS 2060) TaxID=460265 RepID=B8IX96_METNO|nr:hypothetical protein [Methylobacterium nodulans]ACL63137.1 conserved hypothetical protein [Methylobacterium nodulans ORS 2060]
MRRGRDRDDGDGPPSTTAELRAEGITTVEVYCRRTGCRHRAVIATDRFPDDLSSVRFAFRLRCSRCGARRPEVRRDMLAHYAQIHAETGWGMRASGPLPAHHKVVGRDVPWPDEKR